MDKNKEMDEFLNQYYTAENVWEKTHKKKAVSSHEESFIERLCNLFRKNEEEYGGCQDGKLSGLSGYGCGNSENEGACENEGAYNAEGYDCCHGDSGKKKRCLSKRTITSLIMLLVLFPLTIYFGLVYMDSRKYLFISLALLMYSILPFILIFEGRKPKTRELVMIAVLSAITVASRAAFFMLPNFKPIAAMIIISAVTLGPETGFMVACVSIIVSNFMFGHGPWTPWQMASYGIIGFLAGVIFKRGRIKRSRINLCIYGFLSVVFIFGGIMNPASLIMYSAKITLKSLLAIYISGLPFDLLQTASTVIFLWIGAGPMIEKIERVKVKYGLIN